ncbi:MAG: zf-HC2 domain-containing protein [Nitrospirae bacterium]|nr:zf-HC2 domain-containing protein [Nitrospirota bacterium]
MTCKTIAPLIEAYLDNALDPARQAALHQHLEGCPACRQDLAELEEMRRLLREEVEEVVERQDYAGMWSRIEEAVRRPPEPVSSIRWGSAWLDVPRWAFASAMGVLLVAAGLFLHYGGPFEQDILPPNACIVSSVESNNLVLVLPGEQGQPTVIWVYDQPKENGA